MTFWIHTLLCIHSLLYSRQWWPWLEGEEETTMDMDNFVEHWQFPPPPMYSNNKILNSSSITSVKPSGQGLSYVNLTLMVSPHKGRNSFPADSAWPVLACLRHFLPTFCPRNCTASWLAAQNTFVLCASSMNYPFFALCHILKHCPQGLRFFVYFPHEIYLVEYACDDIKMAVSWRQVYKYHWR